MKRVILLLIILILVTGCGNKEKNVETNLDTSSTTTTTLSTTTKANTTTTTTTKTTTKKKTTTKANVIKVGSSTLKYGKYKGDFDTDVLYATITINKDGTATYVGNVDSHGNNKKINLKGTWKVKASSVQMGAYDKIKYDGISFYWSDGSSEGYAIGDDNYFGDQWHGFKYSK